MARQKLDKAAIEKALGELEGWQADAQGKAIERHFAFADFSAAFGFMTRAALAAEKLDHHPEWTNVYKTVRVRLTTHDADGLTIDVALARQMDRLAKG